jgi:hypothetical protein
VTAATSCTIVKRGDPLVLAPGRDLVCALDLGSNNAKLIIMSVVKGMPDTIKDERQCRNQLRLGSKTAPMMAGGPGRPLGAADLANLLLVIKDFQELCKADKGTMLGAEATQWARDATNQAEIRKAIMDETGLALDVLTPEQEGLYGYFAATYGRPEKLALDPGSNSFQLGFWQKGDAAPKAVSIPLGYQRGAGAHYAPATTDTYEVARGKHQAELKSLIEAALAKIDPTLTLAELRAKRVSGELFLVGQDGALHLSVRGELRDKATGVWITDKAAYDARVAMEKPMTNPAYPGQITTVVTAAEVTKFLTEVKPADFMALRTEPIGTLYGQKALANAALVDLLIRELGLASLVLVPQEMTMGYIVAKLPK